MPKKAERDLTRIGWLDYLLMAIGSCLAVYSAGMSIQYPAISYFCIILVIAGTVVSYSIRLLTLKTVWIKFDAVFYGAAIVGSIFFSSELRGIMPEGGFPREIAAAGWLSWMLILGSFATWQDSTLLFQAIPTLALFGLVGCYDTFRTVTYLFFAFLMCLATLFARAHGREMLRKAADSGYFTRGLAPGTPIPSVDTTPGLALKLKNGPWRWIAGPEWALVSALGVILVSLIGAPVIRKSVSGVAGFVKVNQPPLRPRSQVSGAAANDVQGQNVRVGGAYIHGVPRQLLEAQLDHLRYLRSETYDQYTGAGWHNSYQAGTDISTPSSTTTALALAEMKRKVSFSFRIRLLRTMRFLPLPPEVLKAGGQGAGILQRADGTDELSDSSSGDEISGTSEEIAPSVKPTTAAYPTQLGANVLDTDRIPSRVRQLALQVSAGKHNDFEKATAIQLEIGHRILYNLDAAAAPIDKDPVEFALFDQKEAYCTSFASAMVLMARCAGIPARYVQGYLPDQRRLQAEGWYMITDADYHAWAELFFKDAGWVVFDPTLYAQAKDGEGLGDTGDSRPWYQKGAFQIILDGLIAITALLIVGGLIKQWRSRDRVVNVRTALQKSYISFVKRLEKAGGKRRLPGQTADEFMELCRPALGDAYDLAQDLNERFVIAMYSAKPISEEAFLKLRADLKRFSAALAPVIRAARRRAP